MAYGLENISPELVSKYQEEIERRSSKATAKRKMSSLKRFFDWAEQNGYLEKHPLKEEKTFTPVGIQPPTPSEEQPEEPQERKLSRFITPANALRAGALAALVVLIFLLVGRVQIPIPWRRAPASEDGQPAQPGTTDTDSQQPTILSPWTIHARMNFQEVRGGTVTGTQTIGFKLYKTPEGNTSLHNFGEKQVTVGAEGDALIQLDGVPTELFFENEELYLAADIGGSELDQRLPVSTANVASNLQGYYPEEEAGPNAIPVLSDNGSLLLSSEAPSVSATNGNLLVEGNTLTLSTPTASDGDITINPDGSGTAHFVFEGTGQNYLNAQAPNLSSGSLFYGVVANGATGYDLIRLESGSSPVERFSVDAEGDTYIGGNLNTQGNISTDGTTRLTDSGLLQNITGYEQDSGNFSISQSAGDTATIKKEASALSDLATLTLKEEGVPNSIYSTLVLNRINGAREAMALLVDQGNATFNGQLRLGRFSSNPDSIGTGSLVYNTTDNKAYVWNGSSWQELGAGASVGFDAITSGTNTSAAMVVGTGASLDYTGSGTINVTSLENLTASQFLRSDTTDNYSSGVLSFDAGTTLDVNGDLSVADTNVAFDGASTTFTTTGDLTIDSGDGDVIISDGDTINVGGSGSEVSYNVIGDSTTGASGIVGSDNDLYVEGSLEVDGNVAITDDNVSFEATNTEFTFTGDLTLDPAGEDVTADGDLILTDTYTLQVGGLTGTTYNAFADGTDAPEEAAIADDNDLYIGGDLEVDGVLYGDGSGLSGVTASAVSFADITGGTNTTATMTVGTGASLDYTGSGTINATTINSIADTSFLRSDASDNYTTGTLTFDSGTTLDVDGDLEVADTNISFDGASTTFTTSGSLTLDTGSSNTINIATDDDVLPSGTSGTNDIGSSGVPFDNVYAVAFTQDGNTVCDDSGNCSLPNAGPWEESAGVVSLDTTTNLVSIGDSTTEHKLEVEGAVTGKALASLWEKGDQDILVASNSGSPTNVFRLTNSGNVYLTGTLNTVSGNLTIDSAGGQTQVSDDFVVTGTSDLQGAVSNSTGNLDLSDDTDITGNFSVTGTSDLQGDVSDSLGDFTIADNLVVTGTTDLQDAVSNSLANLDLDDSVDISGDLAVNGGNITTTQTTFNLINTTATTINFGGAGATISIGDSTGTTTVNNDLAVDGGDITTSQTTFNLINTTATTLNVGGAATTLGLGAASGTTSVNNSLAVDADTTLGDAITDSITFTARVTQDSDLIPITATGTNDLGSSSLEWDNVYAVAFTQDGNTVCDDSGNCSLPNAGPWTESAGVVSLDTTTNLVSIGDSTTEHKLEVEGAVTGKALVSLWEKGDQDILVASNSGSPTNIFRLTNSGNIETAGSDISTTQTTLNIDTADTGTINFGDGSNTLAAIKDQDSYPFWNLAGKSTTGDPATCAEGDIYYNAQDDTISICHSGNTWEQLDGGGGSSVWSDLTDPTADLTLDHAEYETLFNWDTATDAALDSFTFNVTNDLGTDTSTQRAVVIENADDGGGSGTQDNLLVLDNLDTNEAVTTALEIVSSGGGAVTTAIDVSDSDIGTAISAGANDLSATNWSITGASGNFTSSGLLDINGGGTSDIAGTLRLSGNSLSSTGDLNINSGDGQVTFTDGDTLNIGGLTGVSYNAFADGSDAPEEAAIADDNDVYVGGDLEIDGSLYADGNGSIGGFTQGSVIFADSSGNLTEDNSNLYFDDTDDKFGIGGTPVGKLDVSGAVTGKALVIFDETGNQDILAASASGVAVMTLGRNGDLALSNSGTDAQDIDFDLTSDGDFTISDDGTPFAEFTDGGVFTLDSLNFDGSTIGTTSDTDLLSLATDALTVNGDIRTADTFNLEVGGLTGVDYNAFADAGDAADEAAIAADNDLYIGGDLEVDGSIYDSSGNVVAGYWTLSGSDLYATSTDYKVGIGTDSPISRLHVATNTSTLLGKSALIIDQLEDEDIFTASASGDTKLTLTNSGTLQLFNATSSLSNTSGDITIDAASDTISFAGDDLTNLGYVLASDQVHVGNFASDPTNIGEGSIYYNTTDDNLYYYTASGWTQVGSGSGGNWTHIDHALYPEHYWADDVLVGGDSTASATFRIAASGDLASSNNTIDWDLNNAVDALNIESNLLSLDASNSRVGIGTANPSYELHVTGAGADVFIDSSSGDSSNGNAFLRFENDNSATANLNVGRSALSQKADNLNIEASGDINFYPGGASQGSERVVFDSSGNVGIGISSPTTQLHIGSASETHGLSTGDVLISSDLELDGVLYLDGGTIANSAGTATILFTATPTSGTNTLSTASWLVENTSNVGQAALIVNQTESGDLFTASASSVTQFTIENDGDVTFGDASGTDLTVGGGSGKIDVGTVDPVYNIDGTKYATYMAGMVGVKEEVTGKVETTTYVPGSGYKATIDFKEQVKGSDLWLFSRATDLSKHIEELLVLLSPSGNNNAWYRVNPDNYTLSIYTSRPTSVSYRLTAPRFDADLWTNYNENESSVGFILEDDPLTVTDTGDVDEAEENYLAGIKIKEGTTPGEQESFFDTISLPTFDLTDESGNVIHKIDAVSKFIAANIKAGAVETNRLAVKGSVFVGGNIKAGVVEAGEITADSFLAFQGSVDNLLIRSGLVSPYIETETISPLADSDLKVDLDNSEQKDSSSFGEFVIEGENDEKIASIDAQGNATFSGEVESESTKTEELRAGKIYADEIVARTGAFANLKAATSSAVTREEIENLLKAVEEDQEFLAESSSWSSSVATDSADLTEIATSDLYVTNQAAINSLSVSETIVVGNDFSIQTTKDGFGNLTATSINSLSAPLQLQSLASAPLEIMSGLVRVDTSGDVAIEGNLYVAGRIESSGLTLKEKEQEEGQESELSKLLSLQNQEGNEVASVDASGSAYFDKLVLAGSEATTSASLLDGLVTETNATAGDATIPEGTRQITMRSPKITDYTLIYVTPTSSTQNNVLFVKEKGQGYFVVGFNDALNIDVDFNWWVIDVRNAIDSETVGG